jgi:DHA2 family multidrug resistance protein
MEPYSCNRPTYEVGARKWLINHYVITCAIMELIDASIVNVATHAKLREGEQPSKKPLG